MDWKTLPGFEEKYSKITVKEHKTFGGKVVEALYGAKDDDGNPILPKAVNENGAGRWYGIETDGEYRMFSWQHPQSDGGQLEYGTSHEDHAVEDMENDIRLRADLCKELESLISQGVDEDTIKALTEKWNAVEEWNVPREAQLKERWQSAVDRLSQAQENMVHNREEKEKLLVIAEELSKSTEWRKTQTAFQDLQDEWNHLGNAGAVNNDLWKQFKTYRKEFDANRRNYFANLDEMRAKSAEVKNEIIEKAKELTADVKNWKNTGNAMNELMDEWKAAGSSGRDTDESLWEVFNGIRQKFFDDRHEFFEKRNADFKQSTDLKQSLIERVKAIVEEKDYSREKTEEMKAIDQEWRTAGYSGKDTNDSLWDEFRTIKESFWNAKREDTLNRFKDTLQRKEDQLVSMREELNRLEESVYETDDSDEIHSIERQIRDKKDTIESTKESIEDLKQKISD